MEAPVTIGYAILAAAIYSIVFYAKHHLKDKPEDFVMSKLGATVILGAIIGVVFYMGNLAITAEAVETQLISYGFIVAMTETILKIIYRACEGIL